MKGCVEMTPSEYLQMHANCATDMRAYFVQAEKTSAMLAECSAEPMTFTERFRLMSQGILENDAHLTYLGSKSHLLNAARFGYGISA
jgi:hypothetical protein